MTRIIPMLTLSAYKDCVRVVGRDLLAEVKSLMPASQQGV
jgi:hypothetical protein